MRHLPMCLSPSLRRRSEVSMKYTDEQDKERHTLVGVSQIMDRNDIRSFNGLTLDTLNILKEKNYVDVEECQNDSPTIESFMIFMGSKEGKKIKGLTAHGYIVSNGRDDR